MSLEDLGRIAQDALYFHEGPTQAIPPDQTSYVHQMNEPAGIRESGPWVICLSGLISTQTINQFYLDRQSAISVFHQELGLIITGANSKRQPELATFSEKIGGQTFHMPLSSRLQMSDQQDRLALAYNTFFSILEVSLPSEKQLSFRFHITPKGRADDSQLTLQLCLKAGQVLETAAGRKVLLEGSRIDLGPEEIGGWIRHSGWTLELVPAARLTWPVYPYNPYLDGPETGLEHGVGALSTPVRSDVHEIDFLLETN